jgi:Na+-driven multidrug efflux pump
MVLTVFISLYSTSLVLAALGNESYGVFTLLMSVVGMLMFLNSAMINTSQRFLSYYLGKENMNKQNEIFNTSMFLHLITALIVVVILELMGFVLFESIFNIEEKLLAPAKTAYHYFVIGAFFRIMTSSYEALVIAHEDMLFVAIKAFFESVLKLLFALLITYFFELNLLKTYCLLFSSIYFFGFLISCWYCHAKYPEAKIKIKLKLSKPLFYEMRDFAKWNLLTASTSSLAAYGQGIVLNFYFGTVINSAQGIANQVRGQLEALSKNFSKALSPAVVKSEGAGNRKTMYNISFIGCKMSFYLLFICQLPIMLDTNFILSTWLHTLPPSSVIFVRLVLIFSLVNEPFIVLKTTISAVGKIKQYEKISSILSILPILVTVLLFFLGCKAETMYLVFIIFSLLKLINTLIFCKIYGGLEILKFLTQVLLPISVMVLSGLVISYSILSLLDASISRFFILSIVNLISSSIIFYLFFLNYKQRVKIFVPIKKFFIND